MVCKHSELEFDEASKVLTPLEFVEYSFRVCQGIPLIAGQATQCWDCGKDVCKTCEPKKVLVKQCKICLGNGFHTVHCKPCVKKGTKNGIFKCKKCELPNNFKPIFNV